MKHNQYTFINPYNNTVTLTLTRTEYEQLRPYIQLIQVTHPHIVIHHAR